jgi:SAM-dependent methyltransferase
MIPHHRVTASEEERTADILALTPRSGELALDVGARDGHFSSLLAERFERVIALDLLKPNLSHPRVECVGGDAGAMPYGDASIGFVLCTEVLEHIPAPHLGRVCAELRRVCKDRLLIGVPYRQDTRVGRTTCYSCLKPNPPWGHVNVFREQDLLRLFPGFEVERRSFVGRTRERTNALSRALLDLAGNPYGTYTQDEPCVHCGRALLPPPERSFAKKAATKLGLWGRAMTATFSPPRPKWIHLLLKRDPVRPAGGSAVTRSLCRDAGDPVPPPRSVAREGSVG